MVRLGCTGSFGKEAFVLAGSCIVRIGPSCSMGVDNMGCFLARPCQDDFRNKGRTVVLVVLVPSVAFRMVVASCRRPAYRPAFLAEPSGNR